MYRHCRDIQSAVYAVILICILQKLTSGSINITGQSFTQLLATIDECLTFLRAHMYYKDSALYVAKYEQCLSKLVSLFCF
uniref:Conserved oligomeric Golgi complex subunit 3 n=1 Tax=Parascaris equorum TaxID=6256 RepID=A0A914RUW4_PAREQ